MSVCDDHFQYDAFVINGKKRKLLRGKYPTLVPEGDISHQVVCVVGEKTETKPFKTSLCASGLAIEPSNLNILSQKVEESVFLINPPPPHACNQQFKQDNVLSTSTKTFMKRSDVLEMEIRELKQHNAALKVDHTNQRIENDALNKRITHLKSRVEELQKENHVLRQYRARVGKREEARQKKICDAQVESKKSTNVNVASQTESIPSSQMELFLHDLIQRKDCNKNFPYTKILREVSFIIHYYSPVVYKYVRNLFENLLPHPCQFVRWTSFIDASPGLIAVSFNHIAKTNEVSKKYYSVSCDEMAIRTDIVFNREKLIGYVDGGGLTHVQDPSEHAKNAFFVVATEINGGKSIPIAYILTRGLRASQITEIITKCLVAMHNAGGEVISITFDGLPANFKAMENMGANFELGTDKFKTFIEHPATKDKVYIMPDSSHMFKLVRNNFKACKILRNGSGDFINWGYIARLQEIQDIEGVRAGNKLTKSHIQFEKQKMKTRLCAQALSHSVATAIDFCRKINVDGFKDSEATCEFLDVCDKLFDMFNSRPRGMGLKTPMKISNSTIWSPFLNKAKSYLLTLECKAKDEYKPIYQTGKGTFVKGLVTSITSLQMIMVDIEEGKIILE
ncbi:unnamed protein product [Orchesella dallaii]|uniref:DNA transposase THAP9 n=1 Tax=Orchesella dallaii TaxID=48710 RepID=A0ABP1RQS9_9HEXA